MALFRFILAALATVSIASCSPQFWEGFAQGLAAASETPPSRSASIEREEVEVCVKYKKEYGWSTGYKVAADLMKGSALNRATNSHLYISSSTYVIVWWDYAECSILRLDYYYGSISVIGVEATDQEGRKWKVSQSTLCL